MIKNILFDLKKNKRKIKKFISISIIPILILIFILFIVSFYFGIGLENKNSIFNYDEKTAQNPEVLTVNENFDANIYFNNEDNTTIFRDAIIKSINEAESSIEIAIYSINIKEIFDALKKRSSEGVDVKMIFPNKKISRYEEILDGTNIQYKGVGQEIWLHKILEADALEDIDIEKTDEHSLMHHKFILIDAKTNNPKILFGSTNFTDAQEKYDASYLIETDDKSIVNSYKNEFDLIWNKENGIKKLKNENYEIFQKNINYNNGFIEIWFGPGFRKNSIKYRIIDLIESADKEIKVMNWVFNDLDIFYSLKRAAEKGIDTKIITDDSTILSDFSALKRDWGKIEVIPDTYNNLSASSRKDNDPDLLIGFNPFIHHHLLIIDNEILVTGTNNWSLHGFYVNDESSIVTNIDFMVDAFNDTFDYQYNKNRKEKLSFEWQSDKEIIINNNLPNNSEIIFYKDTGDVFLDNRNICQKLNISENKIIKIQEECNKKNIIIFIIDKNNELIASNFLHK